MPRTRGHHGTLAKKGTHVQLQPKKAAATKQGTLSFAPPPAVAPPPAAAPARQDGWTVGQYPSRHPCFVSPDGRRFRDEVSAMEHGLRKHTPFDGRFPGTADAAAKASAARLRVAPAPAKPLREDVHNIRRTRHAGRVREANARRQDLLRRPADASRVAVGVRDLVSHVWESANNNWSNVEGLMDGLNNDPDLREATHGGAGHARAVADPILRAICAGVQQLERSKLNDHFKRSLAMMIMHQGAPGGMKLRHLARETGIDRHTLARQLPSINELGEMAKVLPPVDRAPRSDKLNSEIVQLVMVRTH